MTKLSDLINTVLTQRGWDGMSVRELSAKADNRLSKDTVAKYRRGDHGVPDEYILTAWADLLDIPISDLRSAALINPGEPGEWKPPTEAARMSRRQREAVTELIKAMVAVERDPSGSRRRDLITGYLNDPSSDPDLVTRLNDIGYDNVSKRPRRGTKAATVWDSRRAVLEQELASLPSPE